MKPASKSPTTRKAGKAGKTAPKPKPESAPKVCTELTEAEQQAREKSLVNIAREIEEWQVGRLPTVASLATLAAAMASQSEKPRDTAIRALELWMACDGVLSNELRKLRHRDPDGENEYIKEAEFLRACGTSLADVITNGAVGFVKLDKLLRASKPSPETKALDMMAKWRAFRRLDIEHDNRTNGSSMSEREILDDLEAQMERDRTQGINFRELPGLWRRFSKFQERDRTEKLSERGKKGGRGKRKVLAGTQGA